MTELWISGMWVTLVIWVFMCLVALMRMAWVDTPMQRHDAARAVLRVLSSVVYVVPLWPVVLPVLLVKSLLQLVRVADLNDLHARDYAPDNDV